MLGIVTKNVIKDIDNAINQIKNFIENDMNYENMTEPHAAVSLLYSALEEEKKYIEQAFLLDDEEAGGSLQ